MDVAAPRIEELAVERALAKVAESFRFVLDVTPSNVEDERKAFLCGHRRDPRFTYRTLEDAPVLLGTELDAIDPDQVRQPALHALLSAKYRELLLQLEMLHARGTDAFRRLSLDLYGPIDDVLVQEAETILAAVAPPADPRAARVGAVEFAALAEQELVHYRTIEPDLGVHVEVRPDVAGVMVSGSILFVSEATRVRRSRLDALIQHEVGTHLLTYANGRFQPVELMASGLANYEETQEGLALVAEFLVGGLSRFRLRQLAARVVAVQGMLAGQPFAAVHGLLVDRGFSPHTAFTTTMRVFRSGGFTKDAIYLRGLLRVLRHLRAGGDLEALWLGKFGLEQLPLIEELIEHGMLRPPRLRPRFLDFPGAAERLQLAATIRGVNDLIGEIA